MITEVARIPTPTESRRYQRTLRAMILIYCRGHHHERVAGLCADCQGLLDYTLRRLELCPLGDDKSTCEDCPVHCYEPERREAVRKVMRYAGPRRLWHHPILALHHLRAKLKAKKQKQDNR